MSQSVFVADRIGHLPIVFLDAQKVDQIIEPTEQPKDKPVASQADRDLL